jgi:ubiquinone/menaquinone biosynthesis C-methylase UbiE
MPSEYFFEAYQSTPPWDIGRHQPAFEHALKGGDVRAPVLDAGCGTGENALYLAAQGFTVTGVDSVPAAIEAARSKAAARGLEAEFIVGDALDLGALERRFATVIDSGLFHTFEDAERERFRESLARVLEPGGRYLVLCFSERERHDGGPRRVTRDELRAVFDRSPFRVLKIEAVEMATNLDSGRKAWFARVERLPDEGTPATGA